MLVAEALGQRLKETDKLDITVVLDPDEEVCRIGYGEIAALELLQKLAVDQGLSLRSQPGLRVGVLLSDDNTMVWSPTPRSVEAPPESRPASPEGISASSGADAQTAPLAPVQPVAATPANAAAVQVAVPPAPVAPNGLMLGPNPAAQLAKAVAAEGTNTAPQNGEIGRKAITLDEVKVTVIALQKNPPIPVDLARVTRVFSTKLQFVEFRVTRAKLSKMLLTVPGGLLNADAKGDLEELIESKLRAFGDLRDAEIEVPAFVNGEPAMVNGEQAMVMVSESSLERERNNIEKRLIYDIKDFGRLIEKDRKGEFELLVGAFKIQLLAHSKGVRALLDQQANQIVDDAIDLIMARHRSGLAQGKQSASIDSDALRTELLKGLERAKGEMPTVSLIFKDVTYEQTRSDDFRKRLDKALPGPVRKRLGEWSTIFDAAKSRIEGGGVNIQKGAS